MAVICYTFEKGADMADVSIHYMLRENMAKDVWFNPRARQDHAACIDHAGVTALVVRGEHGLGWVLLADSPKNPGVSVTNGAELYAGTLCAKLDAQVDDFAWFELDSDGAFDELQLLGAQVGFAPLREDGKKPRSLEAFEARVSQLKVGYPLEAASAVIAMSMNFSGRK
jgi:hypothetical protein